MLTPKMTKVFIFMLLSCSIVSKSSAGLRKFMTNHGMLIVMKQFVIHV